MTTPVPAEAIDVASGFIDTMWPREIWDEGETRAIAKAVAEAVAPYIRASAELAAGKAVMEREERIQQLGKLARNLLARYREVIGSDQPDDIRAEIEAAEAILAGGEQK